MAALVVGLVLLFAMAGHSDGTYCICNSNVGETTLQKNIDYACGNGADCAGIHQSGACYNPNNVKPHCDYAVNSYYQRKRQVNGSCDFLGTASVTQTAPSAVSGCVYQSSPSNGGSTANPSTGNTGAGTLPGTMSGGLGPTGSGFDTDSSAGVTVILLSQNIISMMLILCLFPLYLLVSG